MKHVRKEREAIFVEKLNKHLFFDGAMGTMLNIKGMVAGEIPEEYNIDKANILEEIHDEYIQAGSNVITTNTFGANSYKMEESKYSVKELISAALKVARKSADKVDREILVAQDLGPIGKLLQPLGDLSFDDCYEMFKEQVLIGNENGADLFIIETMTDIAEARAAILAVKENSDKPVFCTVTFEANARSLTGTDPKTMVNILQNMGIDAVGVNCSLGPKQLKPIVEEIIEYAEIPVIVQANAGLPKLLDGKTVFDMKPAEYAEAIKDLAELGVNIIGGCCGTTPEYIKETIKAIKDLPFVEHQPKQRTLVSSTTTTVELGIGKRIIGERINPTGKKRIKAALKENDYDYLISEAISQEEAGADILDVNLGMPGIDEKKMMRDLVKELQVIVKAPLQIDSSNPEVIEEAVRYYSGRAIINSVNAKQESLDAILPIAQKYGCLLIALCMEKGLPKSSEERVQIAEKIINEGAKYGIREEDFIVDTLVLTASAQQEEVRGTLEAIKTLKQRYRVKSTLGASNISFGLPNRKLVNTVYMTMAFEYGLDAPITDPTHKEIKDTIMAYKVLSGEDVGSEKYIEYFSKEENIAPVSQATTKEIPLKELVIKGLKDDAGQKTKEALKTREAMEIVNTELIPALDFVGEKFEKGVFFLPQLIKSADAVKAAFVEIKTKLIESGQDNINNGDIAIATVKGDVHDIGKNIVKVLLENYGFKMHDLGKDVEIEYIVDFCRENKIKLLGLSALMTTTVDNMEKTIKAIKEAGLDTKIFVGGAVLTPEYAEEIGADWYCKDARESVVVAQEFFKN